MKMLRVINNKQISLNLFVSITTCFLIILNQSVNNAESIKQKRQLFREQVLPHKGGKIPDSAFHSERLLLNRLNQQGISIPDGIVLDQRRQEKHPFPKQKLPETLKVLLNNDGRYVAPPGRYYYSRAPAIDTTYIIRAPHRSCCRGMPGRWAPLYYSSSWLGAAQNSASKYQKYINWKPPVWYNHLQNTMGKNSVSNYDYIDPEQILLQYSSYLEKIHK